MTSFDSTMSVNHLSKNLNMSHKGTVCGHQTGGACAMCSNVNPHNDVESQLHSKNGTVSDMQHVDSGGEFKIEIEEMEFNTECVTDDCNIATELSANVSTSVIKQSAYESASELSGIKESESACFRNSVENIEYKILSVANGTPVQVGNMNFRYLCPMCDLNFYLWQNLIKHSLTVHNITEANVAKMTVKQAWAWLCNICDENYMSNTMILYTDHFSKHHNLQVDLKKLDISEHYNEDKNVLGSISYLQVFIPKKKELYVKCPYCTAIFVSDTVYNQHLLQHHGISLHVKPIWFACYFCCTCKENVYKTQGKAFTQCRCDANQAKKTQNQTCPKKSNSMEQGSFCHHKVKSLKKHIEAEHSETKELTDFLCDGCKTSCRSQHKLTQHMLDCTQNLKHTFNAPVLIFVTKDERIKLQSNKIFIGTFNCPLCSTKFFNEKCCQEHILVSHSDDHITPEYSYLTMYYCTWCALVHNTFLKYMAHMLGTRKCRRKKANQKRDLESLISEVWSFIAAKFANVQGTRELQKSGINSIKAEVYPTSVTMVVGRTAQNIPHNVPEQEHHCQECKLVCASTAAYDWHVSTLHNSQLAFNYIMEITTGEISNGNKKIKNYLNRMEKRKVISNEVQTILNHFDRFETAVYICFECCEEFGVKSKFVSHVKEFHSVSDSFRYIEQLKSLLRCQQCGFACTSVTQCTEHSSICKPQPDLQCVTFDAYIFISTCCFADFISRNTLLEHKCMYQPQRDSYTKIVRFHKCINCCAVFNLQYLLKKHHSVCALQGSAPAISSEAPSFKKWLKEATIYKMIEFQDLRLSSMYAAAMLVSEKECKFTEIVTVVFTCPLCGLFFSVEHRLFIHMRHSHPDTKCSVVGDKCSVSSLKCNLCGEVLFSADQCQEHKNTCLALIQYEKKIFFCHSCKVTFPTSEQYMKHIIATHTIHVEEISPQMHLTYGCFLCQQTFPSLGKLKIHIEKCGTALKTKNEEHTKCHDVTTTNVSSVNDLHSKKYSSTHIEKLTQKACSSVMENIKSKTTLPSKDANCSDQYACPFCGQHFPSKNFCLSHIQNSHTTAQQSTVISNVCLSTVTVKPSMTIGPAESNIGTFQPSIGIGAVQSKIRTSQPSTRFRPIQPNNKISQPNAYNVFIESPKKSPVATQVPCTKIDKLVHHCTKCSAKFVQLNQCLNHLKNIHSITENVEQYSELKNCCVYKCKLCLQSDDVFFSLDILACHMQSHMIDPSKEVKKRKILRKVMSKPVQESVENDMHIETSEDFECKDCLAKFDTSTSLNAHTQSIVQNVFKMNSKLVYSCQLCNKSFPMPKHCRVHIRRRHNHDVGITEKIQNLFACTQCRSRGRKFHLDRAALAHHLKTTHALKLSATREYACRVEQPISMVMEADDFVIAGKFFCSECPNNYVTHNACALHVKKKHPNAKITTHKRYGCGTCSKTFVLIQELNKHKRLHKVIHNPAVEPVGNVEKQPAVLLAKSAEKLPGIPSDGTEKQTPPITTKKNLIIPSIKTTRVSKRQTFDCRICQAVFLLKANCLVHLQCEHGLDGSNKNMKVNTTTTQLLQCLVCSNDEEKFWVDKESLNKHMYLKHNDKLNTAEKTFMLETQQKQSIESHLIESNSVFDQPTSSRLNLAAFKCPNIKMENTILDQSVTNLDSVDTNSINNFEAVYIKEELNDEPMNTVNNINVNSIRCDESVVTKEEDINFDVIETEFIDHMGIQTQSVGIKVELIDQPIDLNILDAKYDNCFEFDSQTVKEEVMGESMTQEQNIKVESTNYRVDPLLLCDEKLQMCPVVVLHRL